jgi:hypothetical protein
VSGDQHIGAMITRYMGGRLINFWQCERDGARWLCPPVEHTHLWCPLAPVGSAPPCPPDALTVEITEPGWAVGTTMPYAVGARVGRVGTTLAMAATPERALLVAHALWKAHSGAAEQLRRAWRQRTETGHKGDMT